MVHGAGLLDHRDARSDTMAGTSAFPVGHACKKRDDDVAVPPIRSSS
jgi:hypothetical protein